MKISLPAPALLVLVGPSGSGKSTFARTHFRTTEILSSDVFRGLVSDDENSVAATPDAFEALHHVAALRLKAGLLTVVDATSVSPSARRYLLELGRGGQAPAIAIVLDLPEELCQRRNLARPGRQVRPSVVRRQIAQLRRGLAGLDREGFERVYVLRSEAEVAAVEIERVPQRRAAAAGNAAHSTA